MFDLEKFKSDFETKRTTEATISQLKKTVDTVNKSLQPIEDRIKELFVETGLNQEGEYDSYSIVDNNYIKVIIRSGTNMNQATLPIDWLNDQVGTHSNTVQKSNKETVYKIKCNKKERFFAAYYRKGNGNWKESVVNKSAGLLDNFWAIQGEEKYAYVFFDKEQAEIAANAMCSSIKEFNRQFVSIERYDDFDIANYQEKTLKCADFDDHNKIYTFTGYVNIEDFKNWQNSLS